MDVYSRIDRRCLTELGCRYHEALRVDPRAADRIRDDEIDRRWS